MHFLQIYLDYLRCVLESSQYVSTIIRILRQLWFVDMIRNVHQEKYAFLKVFEDYQRVLIMWAELQKEKMENKTFRTKSWLFLFFQLTCHCMGYHYRQYHHYRHHHYLLNVVIIITIIMIICLLKLKQLLHSSIYFFRLCGVVQKRNSISITKYKSWLYSIIFFVKKVIILCKDKHL